MNGYTYSNDGYDYDQDFSGYVYDDLYRYNMTSQNLQENYIYDEDYPHDYHP